MYSFSEENLSRLALRLQRSARKMLYLTYFPPSRGWLAVVERGKITQSFRRERVCKFAGKNVVFTIPAKQAIYSCQYTGAVIG